MCFSYLFFILHMYFIHLIQTLNKKQIINNKQVRKIFIFYLMVWYKHIRGVRRQILKETRINEKKI